MNRWAILPVPQTYDNERSQMATCGYVRVSSADQNTDRQILALTEAGIDGANMFIDHKSGRDFDRPQWRRMLESLDHGDVVVVQSIDRMGRNYDEIHEQWRMIVHERKAHIRVLDTPILDTRRTDGGLTGRLIGDIVLELMAFCAHNERDAIHERQAQGIAAARRRGVVFGRPRRALPENFNEVVKLVMQRSISIADGARACGMAYTSFRNRLRRFIDGIDLTDSVCIDANPARNSCGAEESVMVQYESDNERLRGRQVDTVRTSPQKGDESPVP